MKKFNVNLIFVCMLNVSSNHATKKCFQNETQYILEHIMNDSWSNLKLKAKVFYDELLDSENIFNQAIILLQDYLVFQALITKFENDKDEEYGIIYQTIKEQIKHLLKINETNLSSFSIKSLPVDETNKRLMLELNDPNITMEIFCETLNKIFHTFVPKDINRILTTLVSEDKEKILNNLQNIKYFSSKKYSKYPDILNSKSDYRYELIIDIKNSTIRKQEKDNYTENAEKYKKFMSTFRSLILQNYQEDLYGIQEIYKKEQNLTEETRFFNATAERFKKEKENDPRDKYERNESLKIYIQHTLPINNIINYEIKESINFIR